MRFFATVTVLLLIFQLTAYGASNAVGQDAPPSGAATEPGQFSDRICKVIPVPLPITLSGSQNLLQSLQQFASQAPDVVRRQDRPIAVLEFQTSAQSSGAGSDFGACISIARMLTSAPMQRIQTIAYVRSPRAEDAQTALEGHAVLVAIAAEDLAMNANTSIGNASKGDDSADPFIEQAYRSIAQQNLKKLPAEVVVSMIQKSSGLYRVRTTKGIEYVNEAELNRLERSGEGLESRTLAAAGETASLTAETMAQYNLIKFSVVDKSDFARQLQLPISALSVDASSGENWTAITIKIPEYLNDRAARWIIRSALPAANRNHANLMLIEFGDCSGAPDAAAKLARFVSEIAPEKIRTVAVIKKSARSGAALVALACDQILMHDDATLGGFGQPENPGEPPQGSIVPSRRKSYELDARTIASAKEKDWSLLLAVIDSETTINRYRSTESGQIRLLGKTEHRALPDKAQWKTQGALDTRNGISAAAARDNQLAALTFGAADEVKAYFQLTQSPTPLKQTKTDRWVESLAGFLTSPGVPFMLLMAGFFCISTEISSPGLGVPGFLGTLCLAAFFWGQFFQGNAQWFEILLFAVGIAFLLLEVFVIPGFGVFGIGGIAMIGIAIVLAAQSFVIPQNFRQLEQLPYSLFPLIGAGFGLIGAAIIVPRILPSTPFLKNIILSPPQRDDLDFASNGRQRVADHSYLNGTTGMTVTKLRPSGRAKFGDRVYDVISDGQVVEKGTKVIVVEAIANRVVVEVVP